MKPAVHDTAIWSPPGRPPHRLAPLLLDTARREGGLAAMTRWHEALEGQPVAYVHGERHDLWWEFDLASSFQWQARIHDMKPDRYRQRLQALTGALEIGHLLTRPVESLTPVQRALADLAVALLPRPRLLLWEEPFALLRGEDRQRAAQLVKVLPSVEGLTAILVAARAPGITQEESAYEGIGTTGALDPGGRRPAWPAGRRTAAGGAHWY